MKCEVQKFEELGNIKPMETQHLGVTYLGTPGAVSLHFCWPSSAFTCGKPRMICKCKSFALGNWGKRKNKHVGNWVTGVTGFPEFPPISCLFSISMWETGGELSQSGYSLSKTLHPADQKLCESRPLWLLCSHHHCTEAWRWMIWMIL